MGRLDMETANAELVFKWFEEVWSQGGDAPRRRPDNTRVIASEGEPAPLSAEDFRRIHRNLKEALTDIRLSFKSFASSGDQISCIMVVRAKNRYSGEPIAFRSTLNGRVRDGQLVGAVNAIDYLSAA
jgi:hypothetical protein